MRLLHVDDHGTVSLTADLPSNKIPPYAILSHTWGPDGDEVKLQELGAKNAEGKAGYQKIRFCAEQAQRDGLKHFWVDTCCIDKTNGAELAESINSMFRWYREARLCYVYLSDVSPSKVDQSGLPVDLSWESQFRASRWFTRGWTLQELIAPPLVQFFARDGTLLGDKVSLQQHIHEITGIPTLALRGAALDRFDVKERFKWSENRQTSREEDQAYCLLGIFGAFISPIYGEGKANARRRLEREISDPHPKKQSLPAFIVPYTRNPGFIGRSEAFEKLKAQLSSGLNPENTVQSRLSLYGLGGIGKTQIALAYTYWLYDNHPDVSVFWIHASSSERFRQAYVLIAQRCQIPGYDEPNADILQLVKNWLEHKGVGRWLIVLDNADDAQVFFGSQPEATAVSTPSDEDKMGAYIPECAHGSVLVTTRNKKAGSQLAKGSRLIEVDKMDSSESHQLLRGEIGNIRLEAADLTKLSSRLEYLPLALVQAASFMRENGASISQYLNLLDESDGNLVDLLSEEFETIGRDSATPHTVTETWIVSFEQIQRQHVLAGDLLSLMSLLDRQAIPREFLTHYVKNQPSPELQEGLQLTKALGVLKAFSFVVEDKDHGLGIHRLIQLVMQKWLVQKNTIRHFSKRALLAVAYYYPDGGYESRVLCSKYLPHVNALLKFEGTGSREEAVAKGSLLHCAAGFFTYQGRWDDAEQFLQQAEKLRREVLGTEHPDTLISMSNLATTYRNQGRWKEAEQLAEKAIETSVKVLGSEHPDTLTSMSNLATTYRNQGRWKEAEQLEEKVLDTCARLLGSEHPYTLISMFNLAATYWNQGRWKEAEQLEEKVLETRVRVFGSEHPDTLTSMGNLAATFRSQGRWKEAEQLEEKVLEICARVLRPEHPHTLNSMANLAATYRSQGRWKEAEQLQEKELEICTRVLGLEHPDTLNSTFNLAVTYRSQGRWKEAEQLEERALETSVRVLGSEHPDTLTSMASLASTYRNQGRWKEAVQLQDKVLETRVRVLGSEHPDTLTSMANLASTYRNQGRLKEAEQLEEKVLETRVRVLGSEHPHTLTSMANLAATFRSQGRLKEAEQLEEKVLDTCARLLGSEHPDTLSSMANLASTYCDQGRWKEAEQLQDKALETSVRVLRSEHPNTLTSMANLAATYWNQGRLKEAEQLEEKVLETRKRVLGSEHPDTLDSMYSLAITWRSIGRRRDCLGLIQECYDLQQRILGATHLDTLSTLEILREWQREDEKLVE